ncbi:PP2C family protein-serine/threonine phosphatase [Paracraurococcus ruber]|nr:SpoIIE family protein phosphatase [Paracraurococcus ruber]
MTEPREGAPDRPSPADCAGLALLGGLPPPLLARILARCRIARFAPGEAILVRDQQNESLHFLLAGQAEIHFDLAERSRPIPIPAGRMFGEMSVIDGLPVSAHVLAGTACRVLLVPAPVFWEEVVTAPGAARDIMRQLSGLLRADALRLTEALRERLKHEALARELTLAREIQMGMLRQPDDWFPAERRCDMAALIEPARLVGGDFYDAQMLGPDRLLLTIGDVAGKGISAALFMVRALTLMRAEAAETADAAGIAAGVNRALAADNPASMFVTLLLAVLDLRSGEVSFANYGHLPPVLLGPEGGAAFHPLPANAVAGIMAGAQGATGRLQLQPGDTLLLYSDGVTEAVDPGMTQFAEAGLLAALREARPADPATGLRAVSAAVARHAGAAEQADDITLLAVRWNGPAA